MKQNVLKNANPVARIVNILKWEFTVKKPKKINNNKKNKIPDIYIIISSAHKEKYKIKNKFETAIGSNLHVLFSSLKKKDISERLFCIDNCKLILFCFTGKSIYSSMCMELGDAIGRNKSVIVYIGSDIKEKKNINEYCKQRGVLVVRNINDLVSLAQEYLNEVETFEAFK